MSAWALDVGGDQIRLTPWLDDAVLTRYCEDVFEPESATATIGIDFKVCSNMDSFCRAESLAIMSANCKPSMIVGVEGGIRY